MKKLMMLSIVVLALVAGPVFAATVFEDDFIGASTGDWTELRQGSGASWGFLDTDGGKMYGKDFEIQRMLGYTIGADDIATLTVVSNRATPGYPYLYEIVAFDGTVVTTIDSFVGELPGEAGVFGTFVVLDGVDISAFAGQELGLTLGHGLNWGQTSNVELNVVPEPATMVLLGLGGLLLRRKK